MISKVQNSSAVWCVLFTFCLSSCVTASQSVDLGPRALLAQGPVATEFEPILDAPAKKRALDAEVAALSNGVSGAPTKWTSGDSTSGVVVPGQPFEVSGRICRRYSHSLSARGQQKTAEATACENEAGIWEPLQG